MRRIKGPSLDEQRLEPGDLVSFTPDALLILDPRWRGIFIFVRSYASSGTFDWYEFMDPTGQVQTTGSYVDADVLQRVRECEG